MTVSICRASRSAVTDSARSRSFVELGADEKRVDTQLSCTPERLRP